MGAAPWLVVRTQPNRENIAAFHVERQGYKFFLPKEEIQVLKLGRKIKRTVVLFPRYLFVRLSKDGRWMSLRGTKGVSQVVMTGECPSMMPNSVMRELQAFTGKDGIIKLYKPKPRFKKGQAVKVTAGPFQYFTGLYEGQSAHEREIVLLELLGRKVSTEFDYGDLEAA